MSNRREMLLERRAMYMYGYFFAVFMHEGERDVQKWRHQKWLVEALIKDERKQNE